MGELYLESRLELLHRSQNSDGGWGYFAGKQSWLEPTTYAMLALQNSTGAEALLERAWRLVCSWQRQDGSVRPGSQVQEGTWVTAHAVTLACVRRSWDTNIRNAVDWLLGVTGAEHSFTMRAASYFHLLKTKLDVSHQGWPWHGGNASWIEPTSLTLVALQKARQFYKNPELDRRIRDGESLILTRRCSDGGWNCGNPNVLNYDLPSYPETTALALIGLQGRAAKDLTGPVQVARRLRKETKSSLAKAWLDIALRCHRDLPPEAVEHTKASEDIMLTALEAIAHPAGNHRLLGTGSYA